ncbi:MAG: hypothetical protein ABEK04_01775 [Candidatus Nanohalobium sp.]
MASDQQDQLYVKIDGQDTIINDLESVQQIVENIREASQVLKEAREVRQRSIESIQNNVSKLNGSLQGLQSSLPQVEGGAQPQEIDVDETPQVDSNVDDSVQELHSELENLQNELS